MVPTGSLPCSEGPITGVFPEPNASSHPIKCEINIRIGNKEVGWKGMDLILLAQVGSIGGLLCS